LIVRDEVIGVMVIQHYSDPEYFTQKDLNLLIAVSDQVALAIDRKKAQEKLKQKEKITRTLFSISNAVNITLNLDALYTKIHSLLGEILDVTNFFIAILNTKERAVHFPYHSDTVDEDFSQLLKNMLNAGSNAAKIVDNMLSFARKGGGFKIQSSYI